MLQYKVKEIFIDLHDFSGVLNIIYCLLFLEKSIKITNDEEINFQHNNINVDVKNNLFYLNSIQNNEKNVILTFDNEQFYHIIHFLNRFSYKSLLEQNNWLSIDCMKNLNIFFNDCFLIYNTKFKNLYQFSNFLIEKLHNNGMTKVSTPGENDKIKQFVDKKLEGLFSKFIFTDILFATVLKIINFYEYNKTNNEIKIIQKNLNLTNDRNEIGGQRDLLKLSDV